jgi:hypothetical protein
MNKRNRTINQVFVILLAVFLVLVAAPAGAVKPNCDVLEPTHPSCNKDDSARPVLYDVSMTLVGSNGLSTEEGDCTAGGHLVMVEEKLGNGTSLTAYGTDSGADDTSEADLWLAAPSTILNGEGCYPAYQDENFFYPNPGPGFLRIEFDRHGTLAGITWHFDVAMDEMNVTHKHTLTSQNKKGRNPGSVTWVGQDPDDLTGDGGVSGRFELEDYDDGGVWTPIAVLELEFNLTITLQ